MVPVIHVLCWHVFIRLFAGFLVYRLQKRLPPGVTAMHTNLMQSAAYGLSTNRLTPRLFNLCSNADSTPTQIYQKSIWMWRSARALSFFGRPTRGLFWMNPALLKRWMILATGLRLTFRVLAIFLKPWPSSCSATIRLLRSSESSLPCGVMLELSMTSMRECERCTTNLNTPSSYAHGPSNTWA